MTVEPIQVLAKPIGPICNLDCKYCFYLEKESLYPGTADWAMSPRVLEAFIEQYIAQRDTDEIYFAWQGGEPTLLGVDYFRRVIALESKHAHGKRIRNAIQTNGVLLDDAWAEFLSQNDVLVGVSIDGPEELHDAYRVDKGGQPTFHRVMRGIKALKRHGVRFNTLTTVHQANARSALDVYRFLCELNPSLMQFIPIVERLGYTSGAGGLTLIAPTSTKEPQVAPWSVEPMQYGEFLCSIFDHWVRNDVGRYFVQMFEESLQMWLGMPSNLCIFRETCGSALAVEHSGDLYSCDHFVDAGHRLGNIMDERLETLGYSPRQKQFGTDKLLTLPQQCMRCDVRFACNGECPKNRFAYTQDGEYGLNYLCAGYMKFFRHIDPCMRYMAAQLRQRQSPAHVMSWMEDRDRR